MKKRYEIAYTDFDGNRCFMSFCSKTMALLFAKALKDCTLIFLDTYSIDDLMGDDLIDSQDIQPVKL